MGDFEDFSSDESVSDILESPLLTPQVSKEEGFKYEVLSTDKLFTKMEAYICEVNYVIDPPLPKPIAIVLLDHFKWDKDRFLECYYTDRKKIFKEAKISEPKTEYEKAKNNRMKRLKSEDDVLCEICFTEQRKVRNTGLEECGHVYCNDCWKGYLTSKVEIFVVAYIFTKTTLTIKSYLYLQM